MATFQKVKLEDVAEILSGGTPDSNNLNYWDNGDICWATLPDLQKKYFFDTQRKITNLGLQNSSARMLPKNTVIFSSRATIGEISIAKIETSTNQGSKNFICNSEVLYFEYLYYYLKYKAKSIEQSASGTTYKEINKTQFSNLKITLPDIKTQTRIASVLSAYDDLIENNEKRIKTLEEMAQLLYTEWFVKFKFPGHEKVKMVDSGTEYGKIPAGWRVGSLDNISTLIKKKYIEKDDIDLPLVDMSRINSHSLSITNTGHSSELSTSRIIFEEYDILFGSIRPYLYKVALAPFKGVTNISVFVLRAQENYLKAFQIITLYREETVKWANHHSAGTKMPVIKWELFKKMSVLIPKKDILEKFENIIGSTLNHINELSIVNRNLSKTRDLLIPQLVTGKRELK